LDGLATVGARHLNDNKIIVRKRTLFLSEILKNENKEKEERKEEMAKGKVSTQGQTVKGN
jgi:adenine/guanine phosphoribosyltransferase-like PRPP-binding protein